MKQIITARVSTGSRRGPRMQPWSSGYVSARARRVAALASTGSLAIAAAALAAQPINHGSYSWNTGSEAHDTLVGLTMSGKHKVSITVDCGVSAPGLCHGLGPAYEWLSSTDATVKRDGSFSYKAKVIGKKFGARTPRNHGSITTLRGTMTVSGKFTSPKLATGSARAGNCNAPHFSADYIPPGQI